MTEPVMDPRIDRFADLVVRVGANVQPDQDVFLVAGLDDLRFARAVVDKAYAAGARRVALEYDDPVARRSAIVHKAADGLRSAYRWEVAQYERDRRARRGVDRRSTTSPTGRSSTASTPSSLPRAGPM